MAILSDKSGEITLTLQPYRAAEDGMPAWVLTSLEVQRLAATVLSAVVSITHDDLAELIGSIRDVADGRRREFVLASTDDDFILEVHPASCAGDFFVGIWVGEPYQLMKGYRFAACRNDLAQFSQALKEDQSSLLSPV